MGPTSYLKVPASTQCSLLKPFHHSTTNPSVPLPLPTITTDKQTKIVPLVIFGYPQETNSKLQVLVQWEGLLLEETSWKDWEQLKSTYHLEGQGAFASCRGCYEERAKGCTKGEAQRKEH